MDKKYYINLYNDLIKSTIEETAEQNGDVDNAIANAESCMGVNEIVGYYLVNYPENYLKIWVNNTQGKTDKYIQEVTTILKEIRA